MSEKYDAHQSGTTTCTVTPPLSPTHVFKLAYALALPGRFHCDLARLMKCALLYEHDRNRTPSADVDSSRSYGRGFHEACLVAQGFYQIESEDSNDNDDDDDSKFARDAGDRLTLPARIDRVWTATRLFLLRGMVSMGDGNGNVVERVEAVPNPATHACVDVPVYSEGNNDGKNKTGADGSLGPDPDVTPADLPSLLPRWNNMALPTDDVADDMTDAASLPCRPWSDTFLWACAGCTLGTHCIPVPEWHRRGQSRHDHDHHDSSLTLDAVTAKVAHVVHRLQFNERQRLALQQQGAPHEHGAVYVRHRRLWAPYPGPRRLVPGPADQTQLEATVTDLFRLLAAKDRELRLLKRVLGKPWMVAPAIRSRVEGEAKAEAMEAAEAAEAAEARQP
ncbi:uncharacterized protein SPSK_06377 [Sporothrix schenckii 1099-18]|uniref:Uncharacterized protein n=2 Tax=Sporothrix schenckii TaxID=29908 RepID=U7PTG8_SPOS1|nr:uncharacterized protein SPSK_06377 [Sporothrix schenckii 1099-18]ERS98251.1 hypothetical protein HMPREF1624_05034 [Sporothrix schenckii ATCC 58251]KJR89642.1 hypothetical protein SPSK_06377 [Sporothrix schenckii 1099-18]